MISRVWQGYTTQAKADAYEALLKSEIFTGIGERGDPPVTRTYSYSGVTSMAR